MIEDDPRVSVVVLTHDRPDQLRRVVARLHALPERPRIVIADNGARPAETARALQGMADGPARALGATGGEIGP